ncbi:acetyltransferase (GNAT) family protein [Roseimicrobium gellanilyticum]|uniref:Acetyltransferase (GNAT) family protein n=1 Tax=Roseimicrobium gellanilyticum TaxID=748857 RepID=A0A366HSR9_9BACT|nr:GNAT family N-acetyltransferase [Roseimicrobium gellanilyticum]RBP45974.1 acetyltransferase (GNAT) family protein [Roseimicrobium gellanilyticum]
MKPHLGKCHIRLIKDVDYSTMEGIYLGHEGVDMPLGYFELFKNTIRDESVIYVVAEADGRIVGGGGIAYFESGYHASLLFGIVERSKCRMGFGTSILLSRLFCISSILPGCQLSLEATEWTSDFFARIGFIWHGNEEDERGNRFLHGSQMIYASDKETFRALLNMGGVTVDTTVSDRIQSEHKNESIRRSAV